MPMLLMVCLSLPPPLLSRERTGVVMMALIMLNTFVGSSSDQGELQGREIIALQYMTRTPMDLFAMKDGSQWVSRLGS